jgi:hypothetical protein
VLGFLDVKETGGAEADRYPKSLLNKIRRAGRGTRAMKAPFGKHRLTKRTNHSSVSGSWWTMLVWKCPNLSMHTVDFVLDVGDTKSYRRLTNPHDVGKDDR